MLRALEQVVEKSTQAFESYDHTKALELTESFFWGFTDDYLELVKERAYGQNSSPEAQASAVLALRIALHNLLRLLAPFIPFATEEAWNWWQEGSIHLQSWPSKAELSTFTNHSQAGLLTTSADVLMGIRKAKSDQKLSMKAEITSLTISAPKAILEMIALIEQDLKAVGKIHKIDYQVGDELAISDVSFFEIN
jgi:valyl-tRNA synthetase